MLHRAAFDGLKRLQHLQLFIAHRVRVEMARRLHRREAEKLQEVVLHHVPERAVLVVIAAPLAHPDAFGGGDLDVVDMVAVPDRLKKRVGEAERHQVLHRFLTEIMVDPVKLAFVEGGGELRVERLRAGEVASERFFHHQPGFRRREARLADPLTDRAEETRRDGEVEGSHPPFPPLQPFRQILPALVAFRVDLNVVEHGEEGLHVLLGPVVGLDELLQRLLRVGLEGGARHLPVRGGDDERVFGRLARAEAVEEAGDQLAAGQVPGAAKDDQVERIDRDGFGDHEAAPSAFA